MTPTAAARKAAAMAARRTIKSTPWRERFDFGWFLLKLAAIIILFRILIFSPFFIPSESMLPRLMIGDYLFVSKWNYGYSRYSLPFVLDLGAGRIWPRQPERGDIVIFKAPPDNDQDYIKRLIGLPGDRIELRASVLYLNGKPVARQRIADFVHPETANSPCFAVQFRSINAEGQVQCVYPQYQETLPGGRRFRSLDIYPASVGDSIGPFVVPAEHMFLMGDNRDLSADSRFPAARGAAIGIVPQENLIGRAGFIFFSTDGSAQWLNPLSWVTAARWDRMGATLQ